MKRGGSGGENNDILMGTRKITVLAGSRVPSRLSMHARDSPVTKSDDSAGPGTPVKSRSLCNLFINFLHALTRIQPLCQYEPLLVLFLTREPLPDRNLEKALSQYHEKHLERYISLSQGTVDNINYLNRWCTSRLRTLTPT